MNCFRDLHIDDDPTSIFLSAKALISLQKLYGRIPKIYGKGNDAKKMWDLLKTMGKEELTPNAMEKGAIDQMIILDRSIDLTSVLATQLTYEGLIGNIRLSLTLSRKSLFNLHFKIFQMKSTA